MITDVPSHEDFRQSGIDLLNLAWSTVVGLLLEPQQWLAPDAATGGGEWTDFSEAYWGASERSLATAASLVHQGADFLLRARIADVSPFLLIGGEPSEWPRGCHRKDTAFSEFRTVDARELVRLHDAVARQRLTQHFKRKYEAIRKRRNVIVHSAKPDMQLAAKDVLVDVLEVAHELLAATPWLELRKERLQGDPEAVLAGYYMYTEDYLSWRVPTEFMAVVDLLQPRETQKLLGFNKRQRRYICPCCTEACYSADLPDLLPNLAQLRPNTPRSTTVYCVLCGKTSSVRRKSCSNAGCKGNVIAADTNVCLTCYDRIPGPAYVNPAEFRRQHT